MPAKEQQDLAQSSAAAATAGSQRAADFWLSVSRAWTPALADAAPSVHCGAGFPLPRSAPGLAYRSLQP